MVVSNYPTTNLQRCTTNNPQPFLSNQSRQKRHSGRSQPLWNRPSWPTLSRQRHASAGDSVQSFVAPATKTGASNEHCHYPDSALEVAGYSLLQPHSPQQSPFGVPASLSRVPSADLSWSCRGRTYGRRVWGTCFAVVAALLY